MVVVELLVTVTSVLALLFLLWYFFLTDANFLLALAEKFGHRVSVYKGKVVWVTGASTGLGEAMAKELASVGAKLILSARNKVLLEEVKKKCIESSKGALKERDVLVLPFDITNLDVHKTNFHDAVNHFGQIDVLVNNAARYQIGPIASTDPEVETDIFKVNFFGGINLTKLVLKHFMENGKGQIVVITSMAGKFGVPSCASYAATKFALHGYYEALRMEHYKNNIRVTMVCPGIFRSSIFEKTMCTKQDEVLKIENDHYECSQMTSERCAHLSLVAAANKQYEAWVANQPFQIMMWASQYVPDLNRAIMTSLVYTNRRVKELNDGLWPTDLPTWQPLFR